VLMDSDLSFFHFGRLTSELLHREANADKSGTRGFFDQFGFSLARSRAVVAF